MPQIIHISTIEMITTARWIRCIVSSTQWDHNKEIPQTAMKSWVRKDLNLPRCIEKILQVARQLRMIIFSDGCVYYLENFTWRGKEQLTSSDWWEAGMKVLNVAFEYIILCLNSFIIWFIFVVLIPFENIQLTGKSGVVRSWTARQAFTVWIIAMMVCLESWVIFKWLL